MVSSVKSRLNFYETLGLTPSATGDAIAQAFVRATSAFRPHAFGGMTELCVAYETLRDPARRRAYDASLGLTPKPQIRPIIRPASAHFMQRPAVAVVPPAEPKVEPKVEPKSLDPVIRRPVQLDPSLPRRAAFTEANADISPIDWKRPGKIFGGLAAAAVSVGALAGWWSGSSVAEPEPPKQVASAARQPEKPVPTLSELWPEPAPSAVEVPPVRPRRAVATRPRAERPTQPLQLAASQADSAPIQPPSDLADPTEADPLAPETAPVPAVAAVMPLPHRTVARTIDRIGYNCGQVASATPVEGEAGVFNVTCTSGQSFRASPVNGRYRFRRLARH